MIDLNATVSNEQGGKRKKNASEVWNFFEKSKNNAMAKCKVCGKEYKTSGNTSNLMDHLKRSHPIKLGDSTDLQSISKFLKPNEFYDTGPLNPTIDLNATVSNEQSGKRKKIDSEVWNFFEKSKNNAMAKCKVCGKEYKTSGNTANLMDHLKRSHPIKLGDSTDCGFKEFVALLDPKYKLPSRSTLQNVYIKNMYNELVEALRKILNGIDYCSLTTDIWTLQSNINFITVTCHFVQDKSLKSAVLSTRPLNSETNHGSQNIAETIKQIAEEWNIFQKIITIVTDNANSMKKACEILAKKHLPCFAHTINLLVQDLLSLESVKALLRTVKQIVTFFKSSTIEYAKLKEAQSREKPHSLIQEVPTQWNIALHMMQHILLLRDPIGCVLLNCSKAPLPLRNEQYDSIADLCEILKPFDDVMKQASAIKEVSVSLIIPSVFGLGCALDALKSKMKTPIGSESCLFLINRLKVRLSHYETRTVPRLATMLDPRFKKEGFGNAANAQQASAALEGEVASLINADENHPPIEEPPKQRENILQFLSDRIQQKKKTGRSDAIITMRQYLEQCNADQDIDPLEFWKIYSVQFKQIAQCAYKYLCVPASSTESERTFSKAGEIIGIRWTRLKPKNVDTLLFLNKNMWVLE